MMTSQKTKHELQNILSGKSRFGDDAIIQTIANHLRTSQRASPMAEEKHQNKSKETASLIAFAHEHQLFYNEIEERNYVAEGAEQRVFVKDNHYVIKLNDAIYYASWEDYFNNLLLHNYFFSDTQYQFLGFHLKDSILYAVVKQAFVKANQLTDLGKVKMFLTNNGFENIKNHDYYHPLLGIILEDLHDENVLTNDGILYFIDTVFFINPTVFWD